MIVICKSISYDGLYAKLNLDKNYQKGIIISYDNPEWINGTPPFKDPSYLFRTCSIKEIAKLKVKGFI